MPRVISKRDACCRTGMFLQMWVPKWNPCFLECWEHLTGDLFHRGLTREATNLFARSLVIILHGSETVTQEQACIPPIHRHRTHVCACLAKKQYPEWKQFEGDFQEI